MTRQVEHGVRGKISLRSRAQLKKAVLGLEK